MRKYRILHVAQAAGGVDEYLHMLVSAMDRERFEHIVVLSQDYRTGKYEPLVKACEKIYMNREIGKGDLKAVQKLRFYIRKYKPDIVYAHSSKAGAIARMANLGLPSLCVYNPHGWAFCMRVSACKKHFYALVEKMAAPFCERIVCISEAERGAALEKKICKDRKLIRIISGTDLRKKDAEEGKITREKLGIPQDAFVVGMAGRLCPQKAPDIFLRMSKYIEREIPTAHFLLIGRGELEQELRTFAERQGFQNRVHITGWIEDTVSYIRLLDVACLLSRWEGFGLVLPEYMLAGTPIVASRIGAIPEIIEDNVNGFLVETDDAKGAADAVMKLYRDVQLRQRFIEQGRRIVEERFDIRRTAREHEILFADLIKNDENIFTGKRKSWRGCRKWKSDPKS